MRDLLKRNSYFRINFLFGKYSLILVFNELLIKKLYFVSFLSDFKDWFFVVFCQYWRKLKSYLLAWFILFFVNLVVFGIDF